MIVIGAGKLDKSVRVMAVTATKNEYGESVPTWNEIAESPRRAFIRPLTLRDQERLRQDGTQIQGEITHQVFMRFHPDINGTQRLEENGRTLEIASVANVEEHDRMLELLCREVVD